MTANGDGAARVEVRLLAVPVQLHVSTSMHMDALQREFDVLESSEAEPAVPRRLLDLIAELRDRYGTLASPSGDVIELAAQRGEEAIDLTFEAPPDIAEALEELDRLLDEVDDYCRSGEHLLTLAAAPEVNAYRRWFLGQFISQVGGAAPVPWGSSDEAHAAAVVTSTAGAVVVSSDRDLVDPDEVPQGWSVEERDDDVVVRPSGELDLQTAPELRDLLLAVRREHTSEVHLDLAEVSFIDSVGLSMVVSAHQRLSAEGVHLVVAVPSRLERLFEISGLDQLLELRA